MLQRRYRLAIQHMIRAAEHLLEEFRFLLFLNEMQQLLQTKFPAQMNKAAYMKRSSQHDRLTQLEHGREHRLCRLHWVING
ncbi:hypothetical protein D3C85_1617720 [compost metagenome]